VEEMAIVVHHGRWRDLHLGYTALGRWMSANNYRIAGYGREVFLKMLPPGQDETNITEIQFPVVRMS
jgi:effector-binding domain-containing protein